MWLVEKERKKAEARKKFEEKKAKAATAATVPSTSKTKEKKSKPDEEILPEIEWYVGTGKKKGMSKR